MYIIASSITTHTQRPRGDRIIITKRTIAINTAAARTGHERHHIQRPALLLIREAGGSNAKVVIPKCWTHAYRGQSAGVSQATVLAKDGQRIPPPESRVPVAKRSLPAFAHEPGQIIEGTRVPRDA
jgi:hypothetical protein